jgi:UDP-glucose 4-epimerase
MSVRKNMNSFVTGATGFLGSSLVRSLLGLGGKVAVLIRPGSRGNKSLPRHQNLVTIEGDLFRQEEWAKKAGDLGFEADVFYHLAWEGVGNTRRNDPAQIKNIEPALDTLALARKIGCKKWVGAGSQAEYGSLNRRISETDPANPTTLYGAAKLAACVLSGTLGKQLGIETSWVRIFSLYGPGDKEGWMLVDLVKQLLDRQRPKLTLGKQLWDYLYIDDAVDAFISMGQAENARGIYNLGSGKTCSIRRIAEQVRDIIDPSFELVFGEVPYRPDQLMHLEANIEKLAKDTGWRPKVKLAEGLRALVDSMKGRGQDKD